MIDSHTAANHKHVIAGDPIQVIHHTLPNGLQLFMSVNKDEPRVYTEIAVRAGSKHDPADTTGLAHYFEHMMFKGTDRMGTLDWEKEQVILDEICELFEIHRKESDPQKKRELYAQIDALSFKAAKLAAANEYDKLVSTIGAKGTNAYTWVEQTVYVNDIPTNELERWFELESERFRRPILRLFHTELETVFEEYNINQDRDMRKVIKTMQEVLTPTHPYGTQTTLGRGEDLKNPSQKNIYEFFDRYYVPNNMGMILCGDFNPDEAIALAEKHFGIFQSKPVPPFQFEAQPELSRRVRRDVHGNEAAWLELGWRFDGANSEVTKMLPVLAGILYNQQAGLIDLHLIQKQSLLEAYAYPRVYEDYSTLIVYGKPREGQTLEQVEALLLEQIERLRSGDFEDWLPAAVVKDMKLSEMTSYEKNKGRASALTNAFILGLDWKEMVQRWAQLEALTKQDIVELAQKFIRPDNYVSVFKHTGPDPDILKVDKPPITPIEVNRSDSSAFAKAFVRKNAPEIEPEFVDFKKTIKKASIHPNLKLKAVRNPESGVFRLHYLYEMGKSSDPRIGLACSYLPYLGTADMSAEEVQKAFYKLGVHFNITCKEDHLFFSLSGLKESFEEGLDLFEKVLNEAEPDPVAYKNLVADILMKRANNKQDKRAILSKAMASYAKYGLHSPFRDKLSQQELERINPSELTDLIKQFREIKHQVYYDGPLSPRAAATTLREKHQAPLNTRKPIAPKKYTEKSQRSDKVYFVHFPMVQVELLLTSRGTTKFNLDEYIFSEWYNQYFGYGLSSIVFQEIRESKALAYAAYAYAGNPVRKNKSHFLQAYVGTQPDKLKEAVEAFQEILENMPISEAQLENARQSVLKQLAAGRIKHSDLFWTERQNQLRGYKTDMRQLIYDRLEKATGQDLIAYQKEFVQGRNYTWMILGDRDQIDFKYLKSIGKVEELSLETVFGY